MRSLYMKKKIFYIGQSYPYPPDSGGRIKALNTLLSLAKEYEVFAVFVSEERQKKGSDNIFRAHGIRTKVYYRPQILAPVYHSMSRMLSNYIRGVPHVAYKYYSQEIDADVQRLIRLYDPDIVHVCHIGMTEYVRKRDIDKTYVLELENVETQLQWSRVLSTRAIFRRAYLLIEGIVSYLYEKRWYQTYDHVFAICNEDAQILRRYFRCPRVSVQSPVMRARNIPKNGWHPPSLLFVGTLGWPPNEDAIIWFIRDILPEIKRMIPEVELHVVGRSREFITRALNLPGIVYHGVCTDIDPFMAQADVFVLPFRIGGGVKMKALTAFSSGIPVVSTPIGVRGYDVLDNKHCFIVSAPDLFAVRVVQLIRDRQLSMRMSRAAKAYITHAHGSKSNTKFLQEYRRVVNRV